LHEEDDMGQWAVCEEIIVRRGCLSPTFRRSWWSGKCWTDDVTKRKVFGTSDGARRGAPKPKKGDIRIVRVA
jgi:hypothetical protein